MSAYAAAVSGIVFLFLVVFICWFAYQSSVGDKRKPNAKNAKRLKKLFVGKNVRINLIIKDAGVANQPFLGIVKNIKYQRGKNECFVIIFSDNSQYYLNIQEITATSMGGYLISFNGLTVDQLHIVLV